MRPEYKDAIFEIKNQQYSIIELVKDTNRKYTLTSTERCQSDI